jgi:hypothetical protein
MTTHQFTSHGLNFIVEGDGFVNARDDFDLIAVKIETALDAMPAAELTRLHAISVESEGTEATALDDIAIKIKVEVTSGWHNANGASVSLIPLPV